MTKSRRACAWEITVLIMVAVGASARGQAPQKASTAPASAAADIVATGWSEAAQLPFGGTFQVGVTVENRGTTPIGGVQIEEFAPAGFSEVETCWRDGRPACLSGRTAPSAVEVAAGSSLAITGRLAANLTHGRFQPTGLLRWIDEGGRSHRIALTFPVIEVQAADKFPSAALVFWATGVGFPGVIAAVTWWVGRRQKKRDAAQAASQAVLDAAAHAKEAERLGRMAISRLMLRRCHEDAEKHYMPITIAVTEFTSAVAAIPGPLGPQRDEKLAQATYRLLLLQRTMWEMSTSIGGLYFKDREGEQLAAKCWIAFLVRGLRVHLHEVDYSLLRSKITKHTEIQEVARLMAGADCHAAFDHMCADLGTWHHAGWGPFLVLIAAFRTVMAYETNRPYELWYTKIDEFPTKTLKEYATGLRDVAGHPGLDQEFAQELEDLGKAIDAYVTTNVAARAKAPAASGQQS